jgi:competence protein ComEC
MEVLNPPVNPLSGSESDLDNNSIVLHLRDGKVSFLLAADIMRDTEWELVRERADLPGTVLKVAHHGSATSTTPEFLAVVNPQTVVISCGADNKFGLPNQEVVSRLVQKLGEGNIYRTDEQGTIEFITDGKRLWVEAGR